jgi:hypothetical protein
MAERKLYYYPAAEQGKNAEVENDLRALNGIFQVLIVQPGHILQEYYELPCLETEEGRRVRGVDSIHRFARDECAA